MARKIKFMSNPENKKRFPLHIHIATLFSILVLAIGGILAWVSYRQISDLTFETTETLFIKTVRQLELHYQKEYRPVATSVRLLANSALARAGKLSLPTEAQIKLCILLVINFL